MIDPQSIDSAFLAYHPKDEQWGCIVKVMKPGAHLLLLNSIKDHHLGSIAAEDAGLEIRDTLAYVFAGSENDVGMMLVTVARKPLEGTVAANVLKWGCGGLNIERCRINSNGESLARPFGSGGISAAQLNKIPRGTVTGKELTGRWPANLLHCGSPAVQSMFPEAKSGNGNGNALSGVQGKVTPLRRGTLIPRNDTGSAARFFYAAPTLNTLTSYLIKLVTQPNGTILTNCDTNNLPNSYSYVQL